MLLERPRWHEPVTEKPRARHAEIWSLVNLTEDTHPIHLHLVRFQILDRQTFDVDEYMRNGTMTHRRASRVPPRAERARAGRTRCAPTRA